jgi:RHS repeat-associated protein
LSALATRPPRRLAPLRHWRNGYDSFRALDVPTSITAPNGANTQYAYDDLGNLLKEVSPDRGTTLYGNDAAGNLTCKADGRYSGSYTGCSQVPNRWVYAYDALNRVTSIDYLATGGVTDTSFGYDSGTGQKGRLTSVAQVTGSETVTRTLSHDPFGNVLSTTQTLPALGGGTKTYTTSYQYTGDNSLKKITYPSGRMAEYVRDGAGRIQQIKVTFNGSTTTLVSNVSYYPFGPPNTIVYNNGLTQTRTHDVQYRLTDLTLAGGTTLEDLDYTYDPAGNVTDLQDQLDGSYSRDYDYDVLNRLKWDNGVSSGNPTYAYDANGNRLTRAATEAGFNAQTLGYTASSNRLSTFNGTSVSYDGLGNVTGGVGAASFSFGANTRLSQIAEYSNDLYLTYNGLGELARTLQTTEDGCGSTTEINREYYHFAPDGRVQWDWLWLDNLPVLQFEDSYDGAGTLIGTTATYLHPDHLGTPRIGTDTAGALVWRYRSDGFGTLTNANSREVRLRLPGQIALGLGAINYNYFRDYDPNTGRYLESDPIGLDGGLNTYGYVDQNPLGSADVLGLAKGSGCCQQTVGDCIDKCMRDRLGPLEDYALKLAGLGGLYSAANTPRLIGIPGLRTTTTQTATAAGGYAGQAIGRLFGGRSGAAIGRAVGVRAGLGTTIGLGLGASAVSGYAIGSFLYCTSVCTGDSCYYQ